MSEFAITFRKSVQEQVVAKLEAQQKSIIEKIVEIYKIHNNKKYCMCDYCKGIRKSGEVHE